MFKHAKVATAAAGLMLVALGPATASLASAPGPAPLRASASPADVTFLPWVEQDVALTGPDAAGDPVTLTAKTGAPNQVWIVTTHDPGNPQITLIINKQTGLCLNADPQKELTVLTVATCNGSPGEQWAEGPQLNGSFWLAAMPATPARLAAVAGVGTDLVRLVNSQKVGDALLLDWAER
jgi:hypothetical protein